MNYFGTACAAALALGCISSPSSAQTPSPRPLWEYAATAQVAGAASSPLFSPVLSSGPSGSPASNATGPSGGVEFGESEKSSLGCLVGGTAATAGALLVGGENIINLIAGGLVVPASPAALYASLFGVVFASFCAVGQAMTPAVIYAYRRYFEEAEPTLPSAAPPAGRREPPLLGRYQKTVYHPFGADPAVYVR